MDRSQSARRRQIISIVEAHRDTGQQKSASEADAPAATSQQDPQWDWRPAYRGRFRLVMLVMLAGLPFVAWGAHQSLNSILTLTSRWLPPAFEERQVLERFMQDFESGDSVLLTWPGCTLDDPRLSQLGAALSEFVHAERTAGDVRLLDSVVTGSEIVQLLAEPPSGLSREEAADRLQGILVGVDGVSSCLSISLTQEGVLQREEAIDIILEEASRVCDMQPDVFLLAGPPIDGWVVDRVAKSNLDIITPPSILICVLLCWLCLRSWPHCVAVIASALYAQGILLAIMHFSGIQMNALFIVLPPLVLTLTVSGGIHLVNYFRDERDTGGNRGAVRRAIARGRGPCLLAAGTTAIGLLSLMRSDITPVTQFGWLAAVGVVTGVSLLFLVLPGVLERWPGRWVDEQTAALSEQNCNPALGRPRFVLAAPTLIIVVCLALMGFAGKGIESITTSITHDSLFQPDSSIVRNYRQLEQDYGPLVPAEVLIHFDATGESDFQERLALVAEVDKAVADIDEFGGTHSAATCTRTDDPNRQPPLPFSQPLETRLPPATQVNLLTSAESGQTQAGHARYVAGMDALNSAQREQFKALRLLSEDDARQTWRISTRVPALGRVDYAESLDRLQQHVENVLQDHRANGVEIRAEYTGIMPMVSRVQQVLLRDLFVSFLSAFALVAAVTIVVLRSVSAGLLVMLPNLFPAVMIFGAMGWLGIPVDIGAMMTASVALGIAVDDTFHFLTWFRDGVVDGKNAAQAVTNAYSRCARAMVQTTLICGLGMAVFGISDFIPTQRFAFLMLALLVAALIGDLVFLPALLSGFTRRVFVKVPRG